MAAISNLLQTLSSSQSSKEQQATMATINDLPDELLCQIFDRVAELPIRVRGEDKERKRYPSPVLALSLTCRRFNKIAPPYLVRSWSLLDQEKNPAPFLKHLLHA